MTVAFKHVPMRFADAFAAGDIAIGTLEHYRSIAGDRADVDEGLATYHVTSFDSSTANQVEKLAARNFRVIADAPGFRMEGITLVDDTLPTTYIFCMSTVPDWSRLLLDEVIFEITNVKRFAKAIQKARATLLNRPIIAPVSYGRKTAETASQAVEIKQGIFNKNEQFRQEREVRIAWGARSDDISWRIVRAPAAVAYIKRLPSKSRTTAASTD